MPYVSNLEESETLKGLKGSNLCLRLMLLATLEWDNEECMTDRYTKVPVGWGELEDIGESQK